jgi:riboflavin kinase/FMN adenylyltransferase
MKERIEILGKIIHGRGYGRTIGFPTLNLDRRQFSRLAKKPKLGVHSGKVFLSGREYRAGVVIGPLDRRGLPRVEAHLIGFKGNAYGKMAVIRLGRFIRPFKKLKTEKELIVQIQKDLRKC